jgi:hypothetical protein
MDYLMDRYIETFPTSDCSKPQQELGLKIRNDSIDKLAQLKREAAGGSRRAPSKLFPKASMRAPNGKMTQESMKALPTADGD